VELNKPTRIFLATPSALASEKARVSSSKRSVRLSNATLKHSAPGDNESVPAAVSLYEHENGIFSIQISAVESDNTLLENLTEQLLQALATVQQNPTLKVLMIRGTEHHFLKGAGKQGHDAAKQKLYQAIMTFPYPVIAAMQGAASGAGFLVGALCDFMVCSEEANYCYTDKETQSYPTASEARLFRERFGEVLANDFLFLSRKSTGQQLRTKGWTCPILPAGHVEIYTQQLAASLADKSQEALRLLKQHLARHLLTYVDALSVDEIESSAGQSESGKTEENGKITSPAKHIQVETHAGHILLIKVGVGGENYGIRNLVADLKNVFTQATLSSRFKCAVLISEYPEFVPVDEEDVDTKAVFDFQDLLLEVKLPVVAALNTSVKGVGWVMSQFCDASIYYDKGIYCAANIWKSAKLAKHAAMIFLHRFGGQLGREILLTGAEYSGIELQQRLGTLPVVAQDRILPTALSLAKSLAELPLATLSSWKEETTLRIHDKIKRLPGWSAPENQPHSSFDSLPAPITLNSNVITATVHPDDILVVKMEDREAKNMFSEALVQGIKEVFEHVAQTPDYKVVILTGYDNYFASGGTKESLVAIQEGKVKFTDSKIYQSALECRVPVIAAMQGHGIGAGWAFGMFADIALLSEESRYVSPYMNYGFTPGAGATFIFPDRIGYDLARETLLTAQDYTGSELRDRGLTLAVLPREQVHKTAMNLARQIARHSRNCLMALKYQWSNGVERLLEETYLLELAMHDKTFVGQSETLKQIHDGFFQEPHTETNPGEMQIQSANANQSVGTDMLPEVTASLRKLLTQELNLHEGEIEENAQFVDLGLDSITGVTWIRKINEKYGTSIEATKVYSYPTLAQLSLHVKGEAEKLGTLSDKSPVPKSSGSSPEVGAWSAC